MKNHSVEHEFRYVFQISKKIIFEVEFYTLGRKPYFITSAKEFNIPRTDYKYSDILLNLSASKQEQNDLLSDKAREFWLKWDKLHFKDIPDKKTYDELCADIEGLKERYNFIERHGLGVTLSIPFSEKRELSKLELKKPQIQTFEKSDIDMDKNKTILKGETK